MKASHQMPRLPATTSLGRRAFTLLEILVVVALIGFMLAGYGALQRDNTGASLRVAQQQIGGLLGRARLTAMAHQAETLLVVSPASGAMGGNARLLRVCQIFRGDPEGSGNWLPVEGAVGLPAGVAVVPPTVVGLVASGIHWPGSHVSAAALSRDRARSRPDNATPETLVLRFGPEGGVEGDVSGPVKFVVAALSGPARRQRFSRPEIARAILVHADGTILRLANPAGL